MPKSRLTAKNTTSPIKPLADRKGDLYLIVATCTATIITSGIDIIRIITYVIQKTM
jgi:hypothetical protein